MHSQTQASQAKFILLISIFCTSIFATRFQDRYSTYQTDTTETLNAESDRNSKLRLDRYTGTNLIFSSFTLPNEAYRVFNSGIKFRSKSPHAGTQERLYGVAIRLPIKPPPPPPPPTSPDLNTLPDIQINTPTTTDPTPLTTIEPPSTDTQESTIDNSSQITVDLKINGSDHPIQVVERGTGVSPYPGSDILLSWTVIPADADCVVTPGNITQNNFVVYGKADRLPNQFEIECTKDSNSNKDSTSIPVSSIVDRNNNGDITPAEYLRAIRNELAGTLYNPDQLALLRNWSSYLDAKPTIESFTEEHCAQDACWKEYPAVNIFGIVLFDRLKALANTRPEILYFNWVERQFHLNVKANLPLPPIHTYTLDEYTKYILKSIGSNEFTDVSRINSDLSDDQLINRIKAIIDSTDFDPNAIENLKLNHQTDNENMKYLLYKIVKTYLTL